MRITDFKFYRFSIPLKSPVRLSKSILEKREGLIFQIISDINESGFGEISPFPRFSKETLNEAQAELSAICSNQKNTPLGELAHKAAKLLPSVRFGIECAIVELKAKSKKIGVANFLSESPRESISVNGLLTGTREEILCKAELYREIGYKTVKLKVGSGSLKNDIELTKQVREAIGEKMFLRLDSNRSWNIDDFQKFSDKAQHCNIEYIEEPLSDSNQLLNALTKGAMPLPLAVALDETTREIPPEKLLDFKKLKAVVLKPTLLGLSRTFRFTEIAQKVGITPVIGSSFESGLGLSFLAKIAAAVNTEDISAGLDTYSWFADDIIKGSLPVVNGRIDINKLPGSQTVLESRLLEEIRL